MKTKTLKIKSLLLLLTGLSFILASCATPMGMTASSTPLKGKRIVKNLGKVKGSSSYDIIYPLTMFFFPISFSISDLDIDKAIDNALKSKTKANKYNKKANALINVSWYEKRTNLLFFSRSSIIVSGEAVILEDDDKLEKK